MRGGNRTQGRGQTELLGVFGGTGVASSGEEELDKVDLGCFFGEVGCLFRPVLGERERIRRCGKVMKRWTEDSSHLGQ